MSRISSNGALALKEELIPEKKPLIKPLSPGKPKKSRTKKKPTKKGASQGKNSIIESMGSIPFDKVSLDTSLRIKLCVEVDGDETSDGPRRCRNIGPDFRDKKRHRELLEILYHELERQHPGKVRIIIE